MKKNKGGRPAVNKGQKQVVVPISMDAQIKQEIDAMAASAGVSRSAIVREAVKLFKDAQPKASPLIVCYGMGLDSTAVLVELVNRGIKPDLILFADTGGEKPETYAYLPIMQRFLKDAGFPPITVVKYKPTRAPYDTLEGKQLQNETLPALAFGGHQCSIVFKKEVQEKFISTWQPALDAWNEGKTLTRMIGYDDAKADRKRADKINKKMDIVKWKIEKGEKLNASEKTIAKDMGKFQNWFPLQDWGLDRDKLPEIIKKAGLPVPVKSACFFCPASKKQEIIELRDNHPDLFKRALKMEKNFLEGKHNQSFSTTKGLGRTFAWADLAEGDGENIKETNILMP